MDVTFLLPVRNGAKYLERSLANISRVARNNDEIIVVNDGSSDETPSILRKLQSLDTRYNFIHTKGGGLVQALNLGIFEASNEVIARADVDDLYSLDRIEQQLPFFGENTSAVFSDYEFFDSQGYALGVIPTGINPIATKLSLFSSQRTAHPSVVFKKSAVLEAGSYSKNDFLAEDLGLWIRLSQFSQIASCPEVLLKYTLHESSISIQNKDNMKKMKRSVLSKLSINAEEWNNLQVLLPDMIETYRNSKFGLARIQLLLRDLLIAYKFGMRNRELVSVIFHLSHIVVSDTSNFSVTKNLILERQRRKSLRSSYSSQ